MGRGQTDNFLQVFGSRRGASADTTSLEFSFKAPLGTEEKGRVEEYVRSRLDHARARCIWHADDRLEVECARTLRRDRGIVRLHLQQLSGVSTEVEGGSSPTPGSPSA